MSCCLRSLLRLWLTPLVVLLLCSCRAEPENSPTATRGGGDLPSVEAGDVLLTQTGGELMEAVEEASGNPWTHCGVVLPGPDGTLQVVEAVGPVKWTGLGEFLSQSQDGAVMILRPREAPGAETIQGLESAAAKMLGRPYDFRFLWDDETLYCSEFVWKLWRDGAGIELVPTSRFSDFDLTGPRAQAMIELLHPEGLPMDEKVVAPGRLADSEFLQIIE